MFPVGRADLYLVELRPFVDPVFPSTLLEHDLFLFGDLVLGCREHFVAFVFSLVPAGHWRAPRVLHGL